MHNKKNRGKRIRLHLIYDMAAEGLLNDSGKKFMKTSDWMESLSIQNPGATSFRLGYEILHATGYQNT
jgi:hypothetical protein